jgi:thioredoxin 1
MPFQPLTDPDDLDAAFARSEESPVVLYKHSTSCPISYRARQRMEALADADDAPPVYEVVVQQARPVSNAIAERLGLRHETPQVVILWQGEAVFDASHGRVTAEAVREHLPTSDPA